jgi:ribulose-phosphate 3-epimerase
MTQISVSVLACDFLALKSELVSVETADRLHIDVMDGHFVPNISIGPPIIKAINRASSMPVDIHLMATDPYRHLQELVKYDVESITIHAEATDSLPTLAEYVRDAGVDPGVAINPETDVSVLESALSAFSKVVVMGVVPGFPGQRFIPSIIPKIELLADKYDITIEVDGGIDKTYAARCIEAGADILVSGSTIFQGDNPAANINELKNTTR